MYEEYEITENQRKYAKELSKFSEEKIIKVERICSALAHSFNAEANKESHQKTRILFQRAAKEWLPFIVYCLTFAPVAGVAVWRIVELEGWFQAIGWIGLILVMAIPGFSAPYLQRKLQNNTKDKIAINEQ